MKNAETDDIPITDFYGETTAWPSADMLYCERLQLRSAMYDWRIKPHRHDQLVQLFYVERGSGKAEVDSANYQLGAGDMLVVPQRCVHTFLWEEGSNGYVLFVAKPLLTKLEQVLGVLPWAHQHGHQLEIKDDIELIHALFSTLCAESASQQAQRAIFMENLALSLFICLHRKAQFKARNAAISHDKSQRHLDNFNNLLESQFTKQHTVEWYAGRIGVTSAHLNHLCKKKLGQSALSVIHQRQLAEAKRSLLYTGKPSSTIAEELGFSDPAYFNRFFKRLTGSTPGAFRSAH